MAYNTCQSAKQNMDISKGCGTVIVSEQQRQAYLRELGIQCYFPRRALPGAKPPRLFGVSLPVLAAKLPLPPQVSTQSHPLETLGIPASGVAVRTTAVAPGRTAAALLAAVSPTPVGHKPILENVVAVAATAAVAAPRFAFAYFPVSEELAVISELPWAKSAAVSPACRQLLAGMLRAMNVPSDAQAISSMVFTWPLLEGPDMDQGEESARQTLAGFLARRLKLRPVRYLLVLAEQGTDLLFPANFDWPQGREGLLRHPHFNIEVVLTRSLHAMDAAPELKREVWQAMQPLRIALASL